ncbi:methylenetetrahydrofolate reductase (NADPH) [Saprolegnia diclina VS20]|uniref:methylenetetrahydrofolate reductase (NADH) n=2 Tax=Saprolegnia TaxID=4769 RepID=T0PWR4_SAPDV|nr:methylenetetrahydrofolate reductase (NADPH) [Saprolegnia diclina VS20]EQC29939.1 methylenetetrahydrofolate reductase (NADPH) [Saprolegnia diclina VS20]|eukprot:XP_008616506.1 methylenetetrahydrofolate reductase (NADPH) [Saprolegnia diclina VS20]
MKIIDKIRAKLEKDETFYSFEYFPPKTQAGVTNLYSRIDCMAQMDPLFCDMTWGAGGSTDKLTLEISANVQKFSGLEMLMHLTCTNMSRGSIKNALDAAKDAGIQNILALRGDPPRGKTTFEECDGGFSYALDLVKYIRQEFGDYFCIAVAGYPEGHPDSTDLEQDLRYLKEKVDAGADFIVSQLFYDAKIFLGFVERCRAIGITCPILPGIMPIQSYLGFTRMSAMCCKTIPAAIHEALAPIKDNDEAVKDYGVTLGIQMCKELLEAGVAGLHMYTLNLERSTRLILEGLDLISSARRELPWRPSTMIKRVSESVRPIFWANRPKSYLDRTSSWDEFPNGRWGASESPAFGDLSESHYMHATHSVADRKAMWGDALTSLDDIYETFTRYCMGALKSLPWCDTPLHLETKSIQELLAGLNRAGFLTINSQPRVNAAPSDDPMFGWGGPGGRVYQKAYVECFVSPANLKHIIEKVSKLKWVQYHAVDVHGNSYSNVGKGTTAVTWGSFPNKEILQPTIVDTDSFMAWKDEAFSLWLSMWASLYAPDSTSYGLLKEVHDTFFLVSIVDNNFVNGNIWDVFEQTTTDAATTP